MAKYTPADLRNVALVGHGSTGKTTLAEALLHASGAIPRPGKVEDGTTVSDWTDEEKERKQSLESSVMHMSIRGAEINLVDTPGYPDFLGQSVPALDAVETAVLVVAGNARIGVNARTLWRAAEQRGLARVVVVNRMDGENASLDEIYSQLRATWGNRCIAWNLPVGEGAGFTGVAPVLGGGDPPAGRESVLAAAQSELMDAIAESDEALMEKYLDAGELGPEEVAQGVRKAVAEGGLIPVLFTAAPSALGVPELLSFLAESCPSPVTGATRTAGDQELRADPAAPLVARVWRNAIDKYLGRVSFVRVLQGTLKADGSVHVLSPTRDATTEKPAGCIRVQGREQQKVPAGMAGELVCLTKSEKLHIGDTITDSGGGPVLPPLDLPTPMVLLAVVPRRREDEQKISGVLTRLTEEDATFHWERSRKTGEVVVTGLSDLHLQILLSRIRQRDNVEVDTAVPRVPYMETVTGNSEATYRHKKQTGGAGQFAEVWIRVRPTDRHITLESEPFLEFESKIVGGALTAQFIASVEKGVRSVMDSGGPVAGFPVTDVCVMVYDGKMHPVDSKDIAFQIAGRMAFRKGVLDAHPVLLEPIMDVEITVPGHFAGDVMGDLSGPRRGRPTGMTQDGDAQVISAQVPLAEILTYSTDLRSLTGGEGQYTSRFSHYDVVPAHLTSGIIARYGRKEAEKAEA